MENKQIRQPKFALYLTALENEIWTALCVLSADEGDETRVGVPHDPTRCLADWISDKVPADVDQIEETIQSFVANGLLILKGDKSDARNACYAFSRHHEFFLVQTIASHQTAYVSPEALQTVKNVQNFYATTGLPQINILDFWQWLMQHGGKKIDEELHDLFDGNHFSFSPEFEFAVTGIYQKRHEVDFFLACWPGYEANRLMDKTELEYRADCFIPLVHLDEYMLRQKPRSEEPLCDSRSLSTHEIKGRFTADVLADCQAHFSNLTDEQLQDEIAQLAALQDLVIARQKEISNERIRRALIAEKTELESQLADLETKAADLREKIGNLARQIEGLDQV